MNHLFATSQIHLHPLSRPRPCKSGPDTIDSSDSRPKFDRAPPRTPQPWSKCYLGSDAINFRPAETACHSALAGPNGGGLETPKTIRDAVSALETRRRYKRAEGRRETGAETRGRCWYQLQSRQGAANISQWYPNVLLLTGLHIAPSKLPKALCSSGQFIYTHIRRR